MRLCLRTALDINAEYVFAAEALSLQVPPRRYCSRETSSTHSVDVQIVQGPVPGYQHLAQLQGSAVRFASE